MRPLGFLHCVGKAVLKAGANVVGLGDVVDQVWDGWNAERDEAARKVELRSLVQMAADEVRQQVEAVVREIAAGQPEAVRRRLSDCLERLPDQLRRTFPHLEDTQTPDLAGVAVGRT